MFRTVLWFMSADDSQHRVICAAFVAYSSGHQSSVEHDKLRWNHTRGLRQRTAESFRG
jgi:hypothetical protein